jgi:hypothetical protein
MATRMQQRRGTAAQWISTNSGNGPILNPGEIGYETDTNKFKIGDGTNHWVNLDYFIDASSTVNPAFGSSITFEGATANDFETTVAITDPTADRTITLPDATGTVVLADGSGNVTVSGNLTVSGTTTTINSTTINATTGMVFEGATANDFETTLTVTDPTADRTLTLPDSTGTIATHEHVTNEIGTHSSDTTSVHGIANTSDLATKTYADTAVSTHSSDTTDVHGITDTSALATKTYADTAVSNHSSDATDVHGIADTSALATKTYADTAASTAASTSLSSHASDTTDIHGIADTSILVTTTGTQTLTNKTITTPSGLVKSDVGLGNVDNTSDANKPVSTAQQTALDLKASLSGATFTGTVSGITKSMVGLANVDNTADASKPVSTAQQTALDLKANLAGPTFTGTVVLPSTTSVGDVSATELGYVNGVTSAIQTQLDDKLSKTGGTMTGAITLSGAPTSDLHAATKLYVDNVTAGLNFHEAVHAASVNNLAVIYNNGTSGVGATLTADTNRAFSTLDGESVVVGQRVLIKNQTDAKQNGIYVLTTNGSGSVPWVLTRATDADNNPTGEMKNGDFTFVQAGTVNASIGFINNSATNPIVIGTDNITYTEFNAGKTVVAGDGLTEATPGTISVASGGITSAMIADGTIVDADVNASAAIAQSKISGLSTSLSEKAPLASPTFTGTVTIPNGAALGTPASATLTNATGLPVATGIANLGTGVATFLTTPSSANLASMVTDEIGTGNLILSDIATNAQSASYTLALADKGKLVEISNASANTLTVPPSSSVDFPVGSQITVLQTGAGQTTITAGLGVTINGTPGLKLRAQWSSVTLIKRLTDTWVVVGDLTA